MFILNTTTFMRLSLAQEVEIHDDIVFLKTKVEPGVVGPTFNPSQQSGGKQISESGIQCFLWPLWAPSMHEYTYIHGGKNMNTHFFFKNAMPPV